MSASTALARAEQAVLAACPGVQVCVAVPVGGDRLDVLVTVRAGADPDAAWDEAVRAVLPAAEVWVLKAWAVKVWVITEERLIRRPDGGVDAALTRRRHLEFLAGLWLPGLGPGARGEPVPSRRVPVAFAGPGSGRAALTWGQRDIWATMIRQHSWLPQGGRRPLPPGTEIEDVAAELAYLHSRYPAMRTRLVADDPPGDDPPGDNPPGDNPPGDDPRGDDPPGDDRSGNDQRGTVRQWVSPSGQTFLEVYDTAPDQDPDALAARVEAAYRRRPYDLRSEWPVRMAVVRTGGVCSHLVVLMHHLALDAGGATVMIREVAAREHREPAGMQPLEQAAWQASEAGLRHDARTLRHFAESLDRLAAGPPPALRPGPRRPRHWSGRLLSPALTAAVATIGARRAVDDATVLTMATATAFARLTGTDRVLMRPRIGNRFRPALADVVCFVAQSGLLVLEVGGVSFDAALDRARGATMTAVKNAYFDPGTLQAILGRFSADHGREPGVAIFFNDRHTAGCAPAATPGPSTFTWLRRGPEPAEPLSVTIDDADAADAAEGAEGAGGVLAVTLHFDTHVIAPELAEDLAWGIERVAIEAAADGEAPAVPVFPESSTAVPRLSGF